MWCSLVVWVLTFLALHRLNCESEVCETNGARSAHVGLDYALCLRCMCLTRVCTRCCAFPVFQFTPSFSSHVREKGLLRACSLCSVKVGLLKTLGFVLRCAVAVQSSLPPAGNKGRGA